MEDSMRRVKTGPETWVTIPNLVARKVHRDTRYDGKYDRVLLAGAPERFYRSVISSGEYAGEYYYLDHSRIEWVWRKR